MILSLIYPRPSDLEKIFKKMCKLLPLFFLISLSIVITKKTGRLVFKTSLIDIYSEGLTFSIILLQRLFILATISHLFVYRFNFENLIMSIRIIIYPLAFFGIKSNQAGMLISKSILFFPEVFDVLRKGIKRGHKWIEEELKKIINKDYNKKEFLSLNKSIIMYNFIFLILQFSLFLIK